MSRSAISGAVTALLGALGIPGLVVCLDFATLGLSICNAHKDVSLGGTTYTALGRRGLVARGLAETLAPEVGSARIAISSLDATYHAHLRSDSFRGDRVTVSLAYWSSGTLTSLGWSTTYSVDVDSATTDQVVLVVRSADAVRGTLVPRRTTQEDGCQHDYKRGACPYRGPLATCDFTLFGANGCAAHFPNLTVTERGDTRTLVQPKPFGGFPGNLPHSLVRRG